MPKNVAQQAEAAAQQKEPKWREIFSQSAHPNLNIRNTENSTRIKEG